MGNLFFPSRGLQQGNPQSPYLFLICKEGLSTLLRMAATSGDLKGIRINGDAPLITHLFFADDSLIFEDATSDRARALKDNLEIYVHSSGQLINFDKSGVFFNSNVKQNSKERVCQILEVNSSINPEKYLGLPSIVG